MRTLVALLTATAVSTWAMAAQAQTTLSADDVVIMRRTIAPPNMKPVPSPTPTAGGTEVYSWITTGYGEYASHCSETTSRPTLSECRGSTSGRVEDSRCDAGAKPGPQAGSDLSGCSYYWTTPDYSQYNSNCSDAAVKTQLTTPTCMRSDGLNAANDIVAPSQASCSTATKPPATTPPVGNYTGCVKSWVYGAMQYADGCSKSTTATRTATCQGKTQDGTKTYSIDDIHCEGIAKDTLNYSNVSSTASCTRKWVYSAWSPTPPANTCSFAYRQTRTASCVAEYVKGSTDPADLVPLDDSSCAGVTRQPLEQDLALLESCTIIKDSEFNIGTVSNSAGWIMQAGSDYEGTAPNRYGKVTTSTGYFWQRSYLEYQKAYRMTYDAWVPAGSPCAGTGHLLITNQGLNKNANTQICSSTPVTVTLDFTTVSSGLHDFQFRRSGATAIYIDNVKVAPR